MSTPTDALNALKVLLLTMTPDGQPAPTAVFVYPSEAASISFDNLPIMIINKRVNVDNGWMRKAAGIGRHIWECEAFLFLMPGPLTNEEQTAAAEALQEPYPKAVSDLLFANTSLSGKAEFLGHGGQSPGQLFLYREGNISWGVKVFWGIRFRFPVAQNHPQTMGA